MKIFLMILFSVVSFFTSAQEKKNTNSPKSSVKNSKKVITISNSDDNKSKDSNSLKEKEKNPKNVKTSPEEFYIINDKPVDKVTYLKYLKTKK